jgi:hypothetical protein
VLATDIILAAVIVPSAMSAALIALLAIDAEVILDNDMTLFIPLEIEF